MANTKRRLGAVLVGLSAILLLAGASTGVLAKSHQDSRYPHATRKEPRNDLRSNHEQQQLKAGLDAHNAGDDDKAKELLKKVLDTSKSKYAQGFALEVLANIDFNAQDFKGAIDYYKKLLELNSLPNDSHFDSMYNMVIAYFNSGDYKGALDELKVWREQGKRESADSYALEGNIYYRQEKYADAIAAIKKAQSLTDKPKESWNSVLMASYAATGKGNEAASLIDKQLAKNPKDKKLAHNALVIYMQSNETDKAIALLDREQKEGMITDEGDYISSTKFYASFSQNTGKADLALKGAALLQHGFDTGAVKATADNYKLLGDSYMIGDEQSKALAAYNKASPLASNGDIDFLRAEVLGAQQNWKESKAVLAKAIKRGVTHKGKAYLLLGKLNIALHDHKAARAAFLQAEKDPDTRSEAREQMKKVKH